MTKKKLDERHLTMSKLHISTKKALLDLPLIHHFLSEQSTWAKGIPLATVSKSIEHSLCFGAYIDEEQVAFARVVTDHASFAYLCDVFVLETHRGRGYSKRLMEAVVTQASLQGLRRFMLATSTAPALYAQYGFTPLSKPENMMEVFRQDAYAASST